MKPSIKLQSLAISNFRAIEDFALPRDGLGWNEYMPDVLLLGGENGSGKTTVLELIYASLQATVLRHFDIAQNPWLTFPDNTRLQLDFSISTAETTLPISITGHHAVSSMRQLGVGADRIQIVRISGNGKPILKFSSAHFQQALTNDGLASSPASTIGTGVLYIPSERSLDIPPESLKTPGQIEPHDAFFWRWERPKEWKDSLEALLFSTRWADLNAREAGQPATLFASYQAAFEHFFADKKLTWTPKGELVVTTAGGAQHPLDALSSGEKQVLLLCAEIHRRWRPGSLVLIDEPELHLHTRWLTELWRFLVKTQKERGGQLIVATQSNHLFRIADAECKAIIGRGNL